MVCTRTKELKVQKKPLKIGLSAFSMNTWKTWSTTDQIYFDGDALILACLENHSW